MKGNDDLWNEAILFFFTKNITTLLLPITVLLLIQRNEKN